MNISGWLRQAFGGKNNDVVRRSKKDVHEYGGRQALLQLVEERGCHLIETESQYVVIYDSGYMKIWH